MKIQLTNVDEIHIVGPNKKLITISGDSEIIFVHIKKEQEAHVVVNTNEDKSQTIEIR